MGGLENRFLNTSLNKYAVGKYLFYKKSNIVCHDSLDERENQFINQWISTNKSSQMEGFCGFAYAII